MWDLKRKNVLVTGGTRGIGAAIVLKFAAQGANVAINYLRSKDAAEKLAEQVATQYNVKAITIQGDVSIESECRKLVQKTIEELGGIDVIVSNAGNSKIAPFEDVFALSAADWTYTFDCLVKANVFLLQEAKSTFEANRDGGALLIMSSLAGLITDGSSLAYSTCRAASIHLTKCLAQSQGPKIRINSVAPGLTSTDRIRGLSLEKQRFYEESAKLQRITTPDDVADCFVFLAQNEAITGECMRIDSGTSIR